MSPYRKNAMPKEPWKMNWYSVRVMCFRVVGCGLPGAFSARLAWISWADPAAHWFAIAMSLTLAAVALFFLCSPADEAVPK
jgi:hypothetical protein